MWTLAIALGAALGLVLLCSLLVKVSVPAASTVANLSLRIRERLGNQFPVNGVAVAFSLAFGAVVGTFVYTGEVRDAELRLVDAYLKADVLTDLLADSAGYPITPLTPSKYDQDVCAGKEDCFPTRAAMPPDALALRIWIERLELSRRPVSLQDLTDPTQPFGGLASLFGIQGAGERGAAETSIQYKLAARPTIWVLLDVAREIGRSAGRAGSPSEKRIHFELAAALARLPSEPYFSGGAARQFLDSATRAPLDLACPSGAAPSLPAEQSAERAAAMAKCRALRLYEERATPNPAFVSADQLRLDPPFERLLREQVGCGFRFARPEGASADLLLQALFQRVNGYRKDSKLARIADFYIRSGSGAPLASDKEANEAQQLETVVRFQRALLNALETNADVKAARQALDFWVGYEQFALICLALFVGALLFAQWLRDLPNVAAKNLVALTVERAEPDNETEARNRLRLAKAARQAVGSRLGDGKAASSLIPVALLDTAILELEGTLGPGSPAATLEAWSRQLTEAIEDSRWLFGWCLSALPAIGFLGTVRGILNALGDADAVSAAQDRATQAIAIGNISGSLSLAFSTTLIALVAVLVLSLLDQWQAYVGRRVVEDTELLLTEHVQPKRA